MTSVDVMTTLDKMGQWIADVDEVIDNVVHDNGPWCVFMDTPDWGVARIMRFWTKRGARKFIAQHPRYSLHVHRYDWRPWP